MKLPLGPSELRKALDDVVVACRTGTCAYVGSYGDYKTHNCPLEVQHIPDVEKLYNLINCDERLYIKMRVLDIFAERVINARSGDVNEDYVSMIYACLEKFELYIEIQNMCLDMLVRVLLTSSGIRHIKKCCKDVENCMAKCREKAALEVNADQILVALKSDQLEVAEKLSILHKDRG